MIALQGNSDLIVTFEKLIETMGERVNWSGLFVIVDNYIILHGEVRSLFFNFDNRRVVSNIIDLSVKESEIYNVEEYPKIQNILNMVLYAFGKWGVIKGLKVDKDYIQIRQLFSAILKEVYVEPEFSKQKFSFLKNGIKITYEDVIQCALEEKENPMKGMEEKLDEDGEGLWHKLIWKKQKYSFARLGITETQRMTHRIGNNFYMVAYLCPKCGRNIHMVVYPTNSYMVIDTEEGQVQISRVYTCNECGVFYTPRPELLLVEGDVYEMEFQGDKKAYDDYKELLGSKGGRFSNCSFNKYVDKMKQRQIEQLLDLDETADSDIERLQSKLLRNTSEEQLENLVNMIPGMGDKVYKKFSAMLEDGYFSDQIIHNLQKKIWERTKERNNIRKEEKKEQEKNNRLTVKKQELPLKTVSEAKNSENNTETAHRDYEGHKKSTSKKVNLVKDYYRKDRLEYNTDSELEIRKARRKENFDSRINVLNRMSKNQIKDLKKDIENSTEFDTNEKERFFVELDKKEKKSNFQKLMDKVKSVFGKNYHTILKVKEEVEEANVYEDDRRRLLEPLKKELVERGKFEVKELMKNVPSRLNKSEYNEYKKKLADYSEIDTSESRKKIKKIREPSELEEIQNIYNRSAKNTKKEILDLMKKLEEEDFEEDTLSPFIDNLVERLRRLDKATLDELCKGYMNMSFDENVDLYNDIQEGDFLPELKLNTLESIAKRLQMLKSDECDLLVKRLQDDMKAKKIKGNSRHHFNPARKRMVKQALPEEIELIDYAVATYANTKGAYEYPIIVVDTSRNQTGREGMIITPENIYCSTKLNAFYVPISTISSVKTSSGLLNKGIFLEQGKTKIKIPYAVGNDELKAWGIVLKDYISYLKEKPSSRQIKYLVSEKHDTKCCYRCGFRYKGGLICPECGYKKNQ